MTNFEDNNLEIDEVIEPLGLVVEERSEKKRKRETFEKYFHSFFLMNSKRTTKIRICFDF